MLSSRRGFRGRCAITIAVAGALVLGLAGPAAAREARVTVGTPPGPGPADFNRVWVDKYGPKNGKAVLVLAIWGKRTNAWGALACMTTGFVVTALAMLLSETGALPLPSVLAGAAGLTKALPHRRSRVTRCQVSSSSFASRSIRA